MEMFNPFTVRALVNLIPSNHTKHVHKFLGFAFIDDHSMTTHFIVHHGNKKYNKLFSTKVELTSVLNFNYHNWHSVNKRLIKNLQHK